MKSRRGKMGGVKSYLVNLIVCVKYIVSAWEHYAIIDSINLIDSWKERNVRKRMRKILHLTLAGLAASCMTTLQPLRSANKSEYSRCIQC